MGYPGRLPVRGDISANELAKHALELCLDIYQDLVVQYTIPLTNVLILDNLENTRKYTVKDKTTITHLSSDFILDYLYFYF